MTTTIQISNSSKEELIMVKAMLEQKTGVKHTLDDAVKWLIAKNKGKTASDRGKISKELDIIAKDINITREDLKELRKERWSRYA